MRVLFNARVLMLVLAEAQECAHGSACKCEKLLSNTREKPLF